MQDVTRDAANASARHLRCTGLAPKVTLPADGFDLEVLRRGPVKVGRQAARRGRLEGPANSDMDNGTGAGPAGS